MTTKAKAKAPGEGTKQPVRLRLRLFEALAKAGKMTWKQITAALGVKPGQGSVGQILRGEIAGGRIISRDDVDGGGHEVTVYKLTAKGSAHLEKGTVETWAREKRLDAVGRGYIQFGE